MGGGWKVTPRKHQGTGDSAKTDLTGFLLKAGQVWVRRHLGGQIKNPVGLGRGLWLVRLSGLNACLLTQGTGPQ